MSQFQFGNFENIGGVSIFQKCPNFNYLIVYFAILPLKEMSEIQKCSNLVRREGSAFFKNVPKVGGGGAIHNGDIVPNFLDFLF